MIIVVIKQFVAVIILSPISTIFDKYGLSREFLRLKKYFQVTQSAKKRVAFQLIA